MDRSSPIQIVKGNRGRTLKAIQDQVIVSTGALCGICIGYRAHGH